MTMNITPEQMRKRTEDATLHRREREEEVRLEELRKQREKEEHYNRIIASVEATIMNAADNEKTSAIILKVMHGPDTIGKFPSYNEKGTPDRLAAGPLKVYRYLEENNFNPTLTFQHDGVGISSWWEFRANW